MRLLREVADLSAASLLISGDRLAIAQPTLLNLLIHAQAELIYPELELFYSELELLYSELELLYSELVLL
ncbi:MAG: hypothetical protein HC833_24330 [Leptolyngbyaceae cyanobacterium RM1_406_9]|nr:hypothetical protein [Leptolyngbyaceae cyanobacterium RM1_406_9]